MSILKELYELFNLIEPVLVFIVFIAQMFIFFIIKKKQMEKSILLEDLQVAVLRWLNNLSSKEIQNKAKDTTNIKN